MSAHVLASLIEDIVALVRQASAAALQYYDGRVTVRRKADASPVTEADHAAEAIILAGLHRLTPDIPAVSEEAVSRGDVRVDPAKPPRRFWLVDPIDGTKEFVAHNGEFTINIGLVEDRAPVLGVLHEPITGTTYTGAGLGTAMRRRADGQPHAIRVRTPPSTGLTVIASRSHGSRSATTAYLEDYHVAEKRLMGSAIKFCLIAEGSADLYPRLGPTMEWDTCAGHALLEAAGGSIMTLSGSPLRYGKPGFLNPDFVARGIVT